MRLLSSMTVIFKDLIDSAQVRSQWLWYLPTKLILVHKSPPSHLARWVHKNPGKKGLQVLFGSFSRGVGAV